MLLILIVYLFWFQAIVRLFLWGYEFSQRWDTFELLDDRLLSLKRRSYFMVVVELVYVELINKIVGLVLVILGLGITAIQYVVEI